MYFDVITAPKDLAIHSMEMLNGAMYPFPAAADDFYKTI